MILEVNDTIEDLLDSGFGTVNSIDSSYTNSITESGITTDCTIARIRILSMEEGAHLRMHLTRQFVSLY